MAVDDIRSGPGVEARIEGIEGFPLVRVRALVCVRLDRGRVWTRAGDPTGPPGEGEGGTILGA